MGRGINGDVGGEMGMAVSPDSEGRLPGDPGYVYPETYKNQKTPLVNLRSLSGILGYNKDTDTPHEDNWILKMLMSRQPGYVAPPRKAGSYIPSNRNLTWSSFGNYNKTGETDTPKSGNAISGKLTGYGVNQQDGYSKDAYFVKNVKPYSLTPNSLYNKYPNEYDNQE